MLAEDFWKFWKKKKFPIDELFLIASSKSVGKKINFKGKEHSIHDLESFDFSSVKIAFFSAGSSIAEKWAPIAAKKQLLLIILNFLEWIQMCRLLYQR